MTRQDATSVLAANGLIEKARADLREAFSILGIIVLDTQSASLKAAALAASGHVASALDGVNDAGQRLKVSRQLAANEINRP